MDGYNFSCVNVNPLFGLAAGKFLEALATGDDRAAGFAHGCRSLVKPLCSDRAGAYPDGTHLITAGPRSALKCAINALACDCYSSMCASPIEEHEDIPHN